MFVGGMKRIKRRSKYNKRKRRRGTPRRRRIMEKSPIGRAFLMTMRTLLPYVSLPDYLL